MSETTAEYRAQWQPGRRRMKVYCKDLVIDSTWLYIVLQFKYIYNISCVRVCFVPVQHYSQESCNVQEQQTQEHCRAG